LAALGVTPLRVAVCIVDLRLIFMNVLYEEDGEFKVGAVLADNNTSLQVEAPHGKRSKVKSASVMFRFDGALGSFMDEAGKQAQTIDLDFLWECAPQEELSYESVARDYYGHAPTPVESAALLLRMHGAPMYFYRKGKGRYRPAPADALKSALASVECKRQQLLLQARYVEQLVAGELPAEFSSQVPMLLYKPDRNALETKALEEAALKSKLSTIGLMQRCGAIPSSHDYHFNRFIFENFPDGLAFNLTPPPLPDHADLPLAQVRAFSIDDVTTTEIDDAFSVRITEQGRREVGIHIAAPALGIAQGDEVDRESARRLSTVYMPGRKITMLPDAVIRHYTLAEGRECPALSLYVEVDDQFNIVATRSAVERVLIAANLRHDDLEPLFTEEALAGDLPSFPFSEDMVCLHRFAAHLEAVRGRPDTVRPVNMDYSFYVEEDQVRIVERKRGSPVDRLVSEMMILVNATWGQVLAEQKLPAIYRSQAAGKVKMSTVPAEHQGLGVSQYAWSSSPLRRYVDLVNQRQLVAWLRQQPPPYAKAEDLFIVMRDFDQAYDTYAEFQRNMERYWCLRWLQQEGVSLTQAQVFKEDVVKVGNIPLLTRLPGLPSLAPGSWIDVEVSAIDLLALSFHLEYKGKQ